MPVIHVSAHAVDVADRAQGLTRGADAYLAEPIEPDELIATAQAVLRYYQARQRAELLAERLVGLADTTVAMNAAPTFARLLEAAAEGAAQIFRSPAAVVAETFDGDCLAGVCAGPGAVAAVVPWVVDDTGVPTGATVRVETPASWALVDWPDGRHGDGRRRPAARGPGPAVRGGPDRHPDRPDPGAASSSPRRWRRPWRGSARSTRSTGSRSPSSAACCRAGCPPCAGLDLAVRYEPASAQTEVGGDFYELVMLDGHLLLAIGDVAGHSLHAATVMAELRHAVRAYAVEGHQPGEILHRVNELMRTLLPNELATLCVLLLHPPTGRVRLASAGHLPPLLQHGRQGRVRAALRRRCSASAPRARPTWSSCCRPGPRWCFYTDGLIERRDADHRRGAGRAGRRSPPRSTTTWTASAPGCWWSWPHRRSRTTSPWSSCAAAEPVASPSAAPSGRTRRVTPRPRR